MSDDVISKLTKEFAKMIADAKEAFIMEEAKPYCTIDSLGNLIWRQKVKLRLAEIKDYEDRTKKIIDDMILFWRESQNKGETQFAHYYIDALQSVRKNLFRKLLE